MRDGLRGAGLAAGLALALAAGTARAVEGESEHFRFGELRLPGEIEGRRIADLDGDGRLDLLLVYRHPGERERFSARACLQDAQRGFAPECPELALPESGRVLDVAELDGRPGAELVVLGSDGARVASFAGEGFAPLRPVPLRSLMQDGEPGRMDVLRFLHDLDGDGRHEWIVPTLEGPALHRWKDGRLERLQVLESPARVSYRLRGDVADVTRLIRPRSYLRATSARLTAPAVFVRDFDGDGRVDLATLGEGLRIFLQGETGRFPEAPSVEAEPSILTPEEEESALAGQGLTFEDFDGDGLVDLLVMKWGSPEQRTRMDRHLFLARPGLRYLERADQVVRSESVFPDFDIGDLNGDGRKDLVVPYFHVAPSQALRAVTDNSLRVQLRLFLLRENGRFAQDPGKEFAKVDRRVVVDYHIDVMGYLTGTRSGTDRFDPLLSLNADVNGDGFADLVSDSGNDQLRIHLGNAEARYASSPDWKIEYESALDYDLADLNGDGRTDLLTWYGARERRQRGPGELGRYEPTRRRRELAREQREERARRERLGLAEEDSEPPANARIKYLLSR